MYGGERRRPALTPPPAANLGAQQTHPQHPRDEPRFTLVDALVVVAYLACITALGVWAGRGSATRRTLRRRPATLWAVLSRWWRARQRPHVHQPSRLAYLGDPSSADRHRLPARRLVVATTLLHETTRASRPRRSAAGARFGLATRRFTSIVFMARAGSPTRCAFRHAIPRPHHGPAFGHRARDSTSWRVRPHPRPPHGALPWKAHEGAVWTEMCRPASTSWAGSRRSC